MPKYIFLLLCLFLSACQWSDPSANVSELEMPEKCYKVGYSNRECQLYIFPYASPSPLSINNATTKDWGCQPFLKIDELMEPDSGYQSQLELGKELLKPVYNSSNIFEGFYNISLDLQCIPESEVKFVRYFVHLPEFPKRVYLLYPYDLDFDPKSKHNEQIKAFPYSIRFPTCEYTVHDVTHFAVITLKDGSELQSKDTSVHINKEIELGGCPYPLEVVGGVAY